MKGRGLCDMCPFWLLGEEFGLDVGLENEEDEEVCVMDGEE